MGGELTHRSGVLKIIKRNDLGSRRNKVEYLQKVGATKPKELKNVEGR